MHRVGGRYLGARRATQKPQALKTGITFMAAPSPHITGAPGAGLGMDERCVRSSQSLERKKNPEVRATGSAQRVFKR